MPGPGGAHCAAEEREVGSKGGRATFLSNILCHEDIFLCTKENISQAKAEGKAGEKVTYRREWTSGGGKPEL